MSLSCPKCAARLILESGIGEPVLHEALPSPVDLTAFKGRSPELAKIRELLERLEWLTRGAS
jgi:hypothetical protein